MRAGSLRRRQIVGNVNHTATRGAVKGALRCVIHN
jgi:hypothetical protein